MKISYDAYSPPDPLTGEFRHLLAFGHGEVEIGDDADQHDLWAALEAAINAGGHAEPGKQIRVVYGPDGSTYTYDAPEV